MSPVIIVKDIHLEKAGEYIIQGVATERKDQHHSQEDGIFSPDVTNLMKRNTVAATSLVKRNEFGMIPVRILTAEPTTLYRGTRLGVLERYGNDAMVNSIGIDDSMFESDKNVISLFKDQLKELPPNHAKIVEGILNEYHDVFSLSKMDLGCAVDVEHCIFTGNSPPIAVNYRRAPIALEEKVDELVEKMLEQNIIRPSQSAWNAPIVVIKKKTGDIRMCIDYRRLNAVTLRPVFPIPDSVQLFDTLEGSKYFSSIDLSQGYYQVPMKKADIEKTAFTTRQGQFEFLRMPMGLSSGPATFQRLMHSILRNENWKQCLIYLDDVLIFGRTLEEHNQRLKVVLQRFREAHLKLSPEKCRFLRQEVEYLGHVINEKGISPSLSKVEKIKTWPKPKNPEELRTFLGLCGYYRRHIQGYANIVAPLEQLCSAVWTKKGKEVRTAPFVWEDLHDTAFAQLKVLLTQAPILSFPTTHGEYILDTDASFESIGSVLSQIQDGEERVIAYASHKLSKAERNYCVTRKELLAVYKYVKQFSHYLYGRQFRIRTDHKSLIWLLNWNKPSTSQYCSWIAELSEYDMKVEHRPGKQHANADALSRIPQCQQCELRHENPMKKRNVKNVNGGSTTPKCRQMMSALSNQSEDTNIAAVIQAMKAGKIKEKNPEELLHSSKEAKLLWRKRNNLCLRGNELYLCTESGLYKWIVPMKERKRLIFSTHKGCGHIGINRTANIIQRDYYWPEMDLEIRTILNTCRPCQERKSPGVRRLPPSQTTVTSFPFEKVAIDITGPLKPSRSGKKYILGIVDYFTKFPMLIPLQNVEAKTVARAVFEHWICLFGAPFIIHTDRGTVFESELFHELCRMNNISKTKTAPFYPKSDGLIERLFSTVKDMIFSITASKDIDWQNALPIISMGLRSSIQKATKVSPYEAVFGQKMRLPIYWEYPIYDGQKESRSGDQKMNEKLSVNEYILNLRQQLYDIHNKMRGLMQSKTSQINHQTCNVDSIPIGSLVMAKIFPIVKGIDQPRYSGPYVVVEHLGPWTYKLRHKDLGHFIDRNIHHLKAVGQLKESNKNQQEHHTSKTTVKSKKFRPERKCLTPQRYGFNAS